MTLNSQEKHYLEEAFRLAHESRMKGSHPFGAVLICNDQVFLEGHNQVGHNENPMKHAEIVLLERYTTYKKSDHKTRLEMSPNFNGELPDIKDCQMFTSTEPCMMCEGAIYTMKVGKNLKEKPQVVFGLDKGNLSLVVRGHKTHTREVQTEGPHLLEEAKSLHNGFWNSL